MRTSSSGSRTTPRPICCPCRERAIATTRSSPVGRTLPPPPGLIGRLKMPDNGPGARDGVRRCRGGFRKGLEDDRHERPLPAPVTIGGSRTYLALQLPLATPGGLELSIDDKRLRPDNFEAEFSPPKPRPATPPRQCRDAGSVASPPRADGGYEMLEADHDTLEPRARSRRRFAVMFEVRYDSETDVRDTTCQHPSRLTQTSVIRKTPTRTWLARVAS